MLLPQSIELGHIFSIYHTDEVLRAILPEDIIDEAPSSFTTVGHIAHMNLKDDYLPYKHLIGQVIMDKNPNLRTVVNKMDNIDTTFRFFKMELLAGEDDMIAEVVSIAAVPPSLSPPKLLALGHDLTW